MPPGERSIIRVCLNTSVCEYTTIEDAVNASKDGDVILLHREISRITRKLEIDKEITIRGVKSHTDKIPIIIPRQGIHIKADGVKLYNLEIRGSFYPNSSLYITSNYNRIQGCKITRNYIGIIFENSSKNKVLHSNIVGNRLHGVIIKNSTSNSFIYDDISHNLDGIWIKNSYNNSLIRCKMDNNSRHGFYMHSSDLNKFWKCLVRDNGGLGGLLINSDGNLFSSVELISEMSCKIVEINSFWNVYTNTGGVCVKH